MGIPISSLPVASDLTGDEVFPIVQSGSTKQTTLNDIPYTPAGTGAVATTVQSKLREMVSVFDFMTAAQVALIQSGDTASQNAASVTAAIQAAIDSFSTSQSYNSTAGGVVYLPRGKYKITNLTLKSGVTLRGAGKAATVLHCVGTSGHAIASAELAGNTRSYQTNVESLQINGSPDLTIISGSTTNTLCGGIYFPSSLGCIARDVAVYYMATGVKLATTQDSQFDNVECLFNTTNLSVGYYGSDTSNALRFTSCRFEGATGSNNVVIDGTSASQVRDVSFIGTKFEGGIVSLTRCSGINFVGGCVFTSGLVGEYMIRIFDSTGADTRGICFVGSKFNSGFVRTTLAIDATLSANPVIVSGNNITSLGTNAFKGNIIFTDNTLYDVNAPYAYLSAFGRASDNEANAVTTPTLAANEANGLVSEVAYSEDPDPLVVFNESSGAFVQGGNVVENVWYKNCYGYDLIVTGIFYAKYAADAFITVAAKYKYSGAERQITMTLGSAASDVNVGVPFTMRVRPGGYFQFLSTSTGVIGVNGAMLS